MSCMVSEYFKTEIKKLGPVSWKESRLRLIVISPHKSGMILVLAGGQTCSVEEKGSHIP